MGPKQRSGAVHRPKRSKSLNGASPQSSTAKQPAKQPPSPYPSSSLSWLWLVPILTLLPYYLSKLHYQLPPPQPPTDENGRAQPSEEVVLRHIAALQEIGYRTVGTEEAIKGEQYVEGQVREIVDRCERNGVLQCDFWVQKGAGYHSFNLIDHEVLKLYAGITNIVLKISAKEPVSGALEAARNDSILLGAHIDSTLPSPGAADDGMGVGVMLDLARVLVDRNESFDNSVLFMWNGGEETLQDGSHLYSTQHETAKSVRAMINLEAAGTTGGALLFQATSKEMIEAYWHVPYPRGTVIAADVFASGIILSDTDFGQFEQYLGVSGLDMAIVGHSYFYHTRKDLIEHIELGSSQHFTDNVMAILDYLLSPASPLHSDDPWSPPDVVYLSLYDKVFLHWTMATADVAYVALATVVFTLVLANLGRGRVKAFFTALAGAPLGLVAGLVSANALAGLMILLDARMTWFSHEGLCVLLYAPVGLLGHLATQYALARTLTPAARTEHLEHAHYYAQLVAPTVYMLILQAVRIRSAYLFAWIAAVILFGAVGSEVQKLIHGASSSSTLTLRPLPFVTAYVVPTAVLVALAMEAFTTTLDIFVPLTGRMGKEAPAEFIIATISSVCGLTFFPLAAPMFHRVSPRIQRRVLAAFLVVITLVVAVFASPWWSPYDFMHPKRVGVQYTYNHTSLEHTAHIAFMDNARNDAIARHIHEHYGADTELRHTSLTDLDSDWDTLYPVSSFLDTYRFPLPPVEFQWPKLSLNATRTRIDHHSYHLQIHIDHGGLVWPVLAFEADIVDWSFEFEPPLGRKRHHIKAATAMDEHHLDLELAVRLKPDEKISIHWSAIDLNQMVPGTASRRGPDMPASKWLMDMDAWAEKEYAGSLDILMTGVVVGVYEV